MRKTYISHIGGLRGFAIALVVLFHVFVGKVSAGVDVFLLIGGVLFLSSQVSTAFHRENMGFVQSLWRIIRRLSPVLIVTTTITLLLSMVVYPSAQWRDVFVDGSAAVGYWENIRMAWAGRSYTAANMDVSPFQHMWSLSAQMHIYVVIMAIVFSWAYLWHKRGKDTVPTRAIVSVVAVLSLLSFFYATYRYLTGDNVANYYSTVSRFWEIGVGCVVGVAIGHVVFVRYLRLIISTLGLAAIVCSGIVLDGASQFPGPWTIVPLLGALAVIVGGQTMPGEPRTWKTLGVVSLFETRAMKTLGDWSYSLYVVHWPILVLAMKVWDFDSHNILAGLAVVAVSVLAASVMYHLVEKPLRQRLKPSYMSTKDVMSWSRVKRNIRSCASYSCVVAGAVIVVAGVVTEASPLIFDASVSVKAKNSAQMIEQRGGVDVVYPGAREFLNGAYTDPTLPIYPDTTNYDAMLPKVYRDGCLADFDGEDIVWTSKNGTPCIYGDTSSGKKLYLVGGSHSEHYISPLDEIGKKRGFAIIPLIKVGCPLFEGNRWDGKKYPECERWSEKVMDFITNNPPSEGVFLVGTHPLAINGRGIEVVPERYVDVSRALAALGIKQYVMRDNPWVMMGQNSDMQKDVRICMNDLHDSSKCGTPLDWSYENVNPMIAGYAGIPNLVLLDTSAGYTRDNFVWPVVGGVLVFRDAHHFTDQFASTLVDELDRQMFINPVYAPAEAP